MPTESLFTDTISAVSTAPGEGAIGIVRLSGNDALGITRKIFKTLPDDLVPRYAVYGSIMNPNSGEEIDNVLATYFKAPRSYTGEDIIEISCHGSPAIISAIIELTLEQGARLAEPGEFTKRAFLNGKLDLAQAEAVADLIHSKTAAQRQLSLRQLDGELSRRLAQYNYELLGMLAAVEAVFDFSDEVGEPDRIELSDKLCEIAEQIGSTIEDSKLGAVIREGLVVAIAGKPNTGKSSLMNALAKRERAIVTAIPGTTRDTLEETISLKGIPVTLVDTAGLRDTDDIVEKLGVERTRKTVESADAVLFLYAMPDGLNEDDRAAFSAINNPRVLPILNKIDLADEAKTQEMIKQSEQVIGKSLPVSILNGTGILEIIDHIIELTTSGKVAFESAIVSNQRHIQALKETKDYIHHAKSSLRDNLTWDLIAMDLHGAINTLGLVTGATATDDLIDRIFSDFCVGK